MKLLHTLQFISSVEAVSMAVAHPQLWNTLSTDTALEIVFWTLCLCCKKRH